MRKRHNSSSMWIIGIVVVTGVVAIFIYVNRKNQANSTMGEPNQAVSSGGMTQKAGFSPGPDTPGDTGPQTSTPSEPMANGSAPTDVNPADQAKETVKATVPSRPRLQEIIRAAKTWMPADCHKDWIGKAAPDFTVLDIGGKRQRLSDYRGKNVIIALFAPSFSPSLAELKMLAQLQTALGSDQLVVLGLSFDDGVAVRRYMEGQPSIAYPIIAGAKQDIPAPYSVGKPMPCAMFISPDGTLKMSTRGTLPAEEAQAILEAQ